MLLLPIAGAAAQEPPRPVCNRGDIIADISARGPEIALSFCSAREREAACSDPRVLDLAGRLQPVALFLACGHRDGVPADRCSGTDYAGDLRRQAPDRFEAALGRVRARSLNADGILWRIEREEAPPSLLYGSYAVVDPRFGPLPAPLVTALRGARALFVVHEPTPPQPGDADAQGMGRPAPFCPYFRVRIGTEPFSFDEVLARSLARDARVLPLETIDELRSWDAERPEALERFDELQNIDAASEMATGLGLYGVEMPTAFFDVLVEHGALEADWLDYAQAYRAYADLRVARWLDRAADELSRGNVVMAIDASYLAGDNGVVEQLRRRGYRVTRVPLAP